MIVKEILNKSKHNFTHMKLVFKDIISLFNQLIAMIVKAILNISKHNFTHTKMVFKDIISVFNQLIDYDCKRNIKHIKTEFYTHEIDFQRYHKCFQSINSEKNKLQTFS